MASKSYEKMSNKLESRSQCACTNPERKISDCGYENPAGSERSEYSESPRVEGSNNSIAERARAATTFEYRLAVANSFRLYAPAVGWSLMFSLCFIVDRFDPQIDAWQKSSRRQTLHRAY